jgi:CHASE3 domain sensor protein
MIETLPLLTPDVQRGRRTIARCHERLARRRKHLEAAVKDINTRYLTVERVLIGGLCVIYISSVALVAIQMLSGG